MVTLSQRTDLRHSSAAGAGAVTAAAVGSGGGATVASTGTAAVASTATSAVVSWATAAVVAAPFTEANCDGNGDEAGLWNRKEKVWLNGAHRRAISLDLEQVQSTCLHMFP